MLLITKRKEKKNRKQFEDEKKFSHKYDQRVENNFP